MNGHWRIVIVEDDCMIAMDLAELLAAEGHEVCAIAGSESDAVIAAARARPDVMIVDAHLSEGNGIAAMRRILARGPMAHVYISGDRTGVEALVPGAIVIGKPFTMPELLRALDQVCASPPPMSLAGPRQPGAPA